MSKFPATDAELVRIYGALGEPTRLRIVRLLGAHEGLTCGEITERLGVTCSTLSHHLALLADAGLLAMRKDGRYRIYSLRRELLHAVAPRLA